MKNKIRVFAVSTAILSALTLGLFVLCLFFRFDASIGYFVESFPVSLFRALTAVDLVWCAGALVLLPGECVDSSPACGITDRIAGLVSALPFALCGIVILIEGGIRGSTLELFIGIFLFLGSIFFLDLLPAGSKPSIYAGFAVLVALILSLIRVYFNMKVAINGPFKNLLELCILSCLLVTLGEIREHMGKPLYKATFVGRLACVVLSFTAALGSLIWVLFAGVDEVCFALLSPVYLLPLLGLGIRSALLALCTRERVVVSEPLEETQESQPSEESEEAGDPADEQEAAEGGAPKEFIEEEPVEKPEEKQESDPCEK